MILIVGHICITILLGWFLWAALSGKLLTRPLRVFIFPKSKYVRCRVFTSLAFSFITSLIFAKVYGSGIYSNWMVGIIMLFTYGITALLLYISHEDIRNMQVPRLHLTVLTATLLLINILLLLFGGLLSLYYLWGGHTFVPVQNIASGLLFASGVSLIIILTKGKGMGRADIAVAASLGLLNGYSGSILGIYIAIFSALVYGLIVAARRGKIKNTRIPFIPFLVLGTIIAFLLPDDTLLTILQFLRH